MRIYGISGLGADESIFTFLKPEVIALKWLPPHKNESLESYSRRMTALIDTSEPFALAGVSMGGMIAMEMGKILKVEKIFLISSAAKRSELPLAYRILGKLDLLKIFPHEFFKPSEPFISWLFRTKNRKLIRTILKGTDTYFNKWAASELVKWENEKVLPVIRIHGDRDRVLKLPKHCDYIIEGGGHFIIVDNADEISEIIKKELNMP